MSVAVAREVSPATVVAYQASKLLKKVGISGRDQCKICLDDKSMEIFSNKSSLFKFITLLLSFEILIDNVKASDLSVIKSIGCASIVLNGPARALGLDRGVNRAVSTANEVLKYIGIRVCRYSRACERLCETTRQRSCVCC